MSCEHFPGSGDARVARGGGTRLLFRHRSRYHSSWVLFVTKSDLGSIFTFVVVFVAFSRVSAIRHRPFSALGRTQLFVAFPLMLFCSEWTNRTCKRSSMLNIDHKSEALCLSTSETLWHRSLSLFGRYCLLFKLLVNFTGHWQYTLIAPFEV